MKEEINNAGFVYLRRGPEARIALCKCKESRKVYDIRMEKAQDGWNCTWAFQISDDSFTCDWCGTIGSLTDYDGAGFKSGGDRG